MPYHMKQSGEQWCVYKGTEKSPGEQMHCYSGSDARSKARKYLAALWMHAAGDVKDHYDTEMGLSPKTLELSGANVQDLLESRIHHAFTMAADVMYGRGLLNRDERIRLSGGIGDALQVMSHMMGEMGLSERGVPNDVLSLAMGGWMKSYQEIGDSTADRWIAVSTVEMWDRTDEMMTTAAIDKDIARVERSGAYPELRLWHVRGFKLGTCDRMTRIGKYAVDYGYWNDTPLAAAVKDLVIDNDGTWRVSRGFFPVKATGSCPSCDSSLMVGPVHFLMGMKCPKCDTSYPSPTALKMLKHLETFTYDITITDVPIVPNTAVSAWLSGQT